MQHLFVHLHLLILKLLHNLIQAKKHVFVEKPMTYLSEDGEDLLEIAKKNKVYLHVGILKDSIQLLIL